MADESDSLPRDRFERRSQRQVAVASELRLPAERDIDRLFYTSYFRRLAEITQVSSRAGSLDDLAPIGAGGPQHNRLTHSLKVGQVAGRLAQGLIGQSQNSAGIQKAGGLDPVVAEAAGRAHDLGHPPYGHVGEEVLDAVARARGLSDGFEGNAQTFRILSALVRRVSVDEPGVHGLDLTDATLAACVKYPWTRAKDGKKFLKFACIDLDEGPFRECVRPLLYDDELGTLEAQVMDWADDITYAAHDIEDFTLSGDIPLSLLRHHNAGSADSPDYRPVALDEFNSFWDYATTRLGGNAKVAHADARLEFQKLASAFPQRRPDGSRESEAHLGALSSRVITLGVQATRVDVNGHLHVDPQIRSLIDILKQLTWYYVIDRPALVAVQRGQRKRLEAVTQELIAWALEAFRRTDRPPWGGEEVPLSADVRRANAGTLPPLLRDFCSSLLDANDRAGAYASDDHNIVRGVLDFVASQQESDVEWYAARLLV